VRVECEGNRTLLKADPDSPIHAELCTLVRNTVGLAEPLRAALRAAQPHLLACFAFEPERDPCCPWQRDFGLVAVVPDEPIGLATLDFGREQAEHALGRSFWIVTPNVKRLRGDPFLAQVMERPRVWVFGSEARLQSLLGKGYWG
jgi:hypothetical protein